MSWAYVNLFECVMSTRVTGAIFEPEDHPTDRGLGAKAVVNTSGDYQGSATVPVRICTDKATE